MAVKVSDQIATLAREATSPPLTKKEEARLKAEAKFQEILKKTHAAIAANVDLTDPAVRDAITIVTRHWKNGQHDTLIMQDAGKHYIVFQDKPYAKIVDQMRREDPEVYRKLGQELGYDPSEHRRLRLEIPAKKGGEYNHISLKHYKDSKSDLDRPHVVVQYSRTVLRQAVARALNEDEFVAKTPLGLKYLDPLVLLMGPA